MVTRWALWAVAPTLVLAVALSAGQAQSGSDEPKSVESAREAYESDFVRAVEPFQRKYRQALEEYQRLFTRNGSLDAAREAKDEVERVNLWRTIPDGKVKGARTLTNPQLNSLLQGYETAVLAAIEPVTKNYIARLVRLRENLSTNANLDALELIDQRLRAAQAGQSLPVNVGERKYLSGLSKSEFVEWLQRQEFEFSGIVAGRTQLKFDGEKVAYGSGAQAPIYDYELSGSRKIKINGGVDKKGFTMEFSRDLQSATFISLRGEYPIEIRTPVAD